MSEEKTYEGGCHCGKVRYEVKMAIGEVLSCNCSICGKSGSLLTFVGHDSFKLLKGEESLKDYQFNKHHIHHMICTDCGIKSFATGAMPDGAKMAAINVRCLDGVDVQSLKVKHIDGKST